MASAAWYSKFFGVLCGLLLLGGCLVTDRVGLVPPGGKSGAAAKAEIFAATAAAYVQGVLIFGNIDGIQSDVGGAGLTAALLTESLLGLEDDVPYERAGIKNCVDAINGGIPFIVAGFLAEEQDCPDAPADCFVDKTKLSGVAQKTAFWTTLIGCGDIARTGQLIHFFDFSY